MINITYDYGQEGFVVDDNANLYIAYGDDVPKGSSMCDTIKVREKTVYIDLLNARLKIMGLVSTWLANKIKVVCIHVPHALVQAGGHIVDHVLSKVIAEFFQSNHLHSLELRVVHRTGRSEVLDVAVRKVRKVLGARMFAMLPANVATPQYMARTLRTLFSHIKNCRVTTFDHTQLKAKGFGLILGVGNSGTIKPTFVVVERKGKPGAPVVAIAGKGITFDTGGLAVKTYASMVDMKYDKIGAVYAASALLHLMEDPMLAHITFIGAFPFAENAISDKALMPGDVIVSYNKKTVEITNPDAEGRLVLADAFAYIDKYKPDLLIDIATLTGHASKINCWHAGYFYANDATLKSEVEDVTNKNGERMLSMPMWDDYDSVLQSNVADFVNSPFSCSDAFVAALFLKQFVPKNAAWLHIDLAHEFTVGSVPRGNGVRTIIDVVHSFLQRQKK